MCEVSKVCASKDHVCVIDDKGRMLECNKWICSMDRKKQGGERKILGRSEVLYKML